MKKASVLYLAVTAVFLCALLILMLGRNLPGVQFHTAQQAPSTASNEPVLEKGKYDLNLITAEQLQELPDIGPVLSQRIIDYREKYGPFSSIDQLCRVDGISTKRLEQMRDYLTVGG